MKNDQIQSPLLESGVFGKLRTRNPLESLSSFVNSFELRAVGSKISHSASSIRRTVSSRLTEIPLFPSDETSDDDNESTLNDDDWLMSPTQKQKVGPPSQILDVAEEPVLTVTYVSNEHLPHSDIQHFTVAQDVIPRIDEDELCKVVEGRYADQFQEFIIIDCRFPYEFEGGHIASAINISLQLALEERFLAHAHTEAPCRRLLIFHCEYSRLRGPTMAGHLRKFDRLHNTDRYPYLHYPDIVVLDGGYKRFFDKYKHLCSPQAYVEMKDNNHRQTCEIEMSKVMQASKLTRAKSFNQFQPRVSAGHARSNSSTALLTSSSENLGTMYSTPSFSRKRSLKIKKKNRKDSVRAQFTQLLVCLSTAADSMNLDSPTISQFDSEDFAPPTALFRSHSKSLSSLLFSVNSSLLLMCLGSLSPTYSSSELLLEYSPFIEAPDFFDEARTDSNFSLSPRRSASLKSNSLNPKSHHNSSLSQKSRLRPTSIRPSLKLATPHTIRSPLATSASAFALTATPIDSLKAVDPINESPVDFPLNFKSYFHSQSSLGFSQSSDLNDVNEESD